MHSYLLFSMMLLLVLLAFPTALSSSDLSVNEILSEMKANKRFVFAAGSDDSKIVIFISGSSGSADFSNGYQIESHSQPSDGKFEKLANAKKLSKYSKASFSSDELLFTTKDSKGIEFVGMSKKSVNVLNLDSGDFNAAQITADLVENCYHKSALHLSSSDAGTYYVLDSKGKLLKVTFDDADSVVSAGACGEKPLGHLCLSDKTVTVSKTCKDPPPADIQSGLVTSSTVYLFNKNGDLCYFSANAFKQSTSAEMTLVKSADAWPTNPTTSSSHSSHEAHSSNGPVSAALPIGAIIGGICLIIFAGIVIILVVIYCKKNSKKVGKDNRKAKETGQSKKRNSPGKSKKTSSGRKKANSSRKGASNLSSKSAASSV